MIKKIIRKILEFFGFLKPISEPIPEPPVYIQPRVDADVELDVARYPVPPEPPIEVIPEPLIDVLPPPGFDPGGGPGPILMADQGDFPDIYLDESAETGGVGSEADPYSDFSEINWTTGGDNSVFDAVAANEDVTINLNKGETWREQMTVGTSGSAAHPITIQSYGAGADPIISGADLMTTWIAHVDWLTAKSWADNTQLTDGGTSNWRFVIPANASSYDGTKIRITLEGATAGGGAAVIGTSIQEATSGPDYDSAPTRITWDTGNSGTTVAQSTQEVSDDITFSFDKTKRYLIHLYTTDRDFRGAPDTNAGMYYRNYATDDTMTEDLTSTGGYVLNATAIFGIVKFEVYDTVANVWKKTGVTTEPKVVIYDGTWGEYESGGTSSLGTEKEWYWASDVLYVYTPGGDPDSQWASGIDVGQRNDSIVLTSKSYVTIQDLDLRYGNRNGVSSSSANVIIDDCTISMFGKCGFWGYGATYNTISNNTMSYFSWGVALENDSDNNTIESNEISESRTTGVQTGGGGIGLYSSDSNIIRYNLLHTSRLVGSDRQGDGIYLDNTLTCSSTEIYYNIIFEFNDGVNIFGSSNELYNNVVYNNQYPALHLGDSADGNLIKNNIFMNSVVNNILLNCVDAATDNTLDNNCYYDSDSLDVISWNITGSEVWGTMTLAEFQAHSKYDLNSIQSDPLMLDPANDKFQLQVTSPCIGAGTDVSLTTDYLGNPLPINTTFDIGAYEYLGFPMTTQTATFVVYAPTTATVTNVLSGMGMTLTMNM